MNPLPGVSVIIPNRNNALYLRQCLGSVLEESAVSEVLIFDDSSEDASVEIIGRIGNPKIRLFRSDTVIGAAAARSRLIARASCDYIFLVDGDDYLEKGTIDHAFAASLANNWDLTIPDMIKVDQCGLAPSLFVSRPSAPISGGDAFRLTLRKWEAHGMGILKKSIYLEAERDFEFTGFSSDELLTREILLRCKLVGGCGGAYFYRWVKKAITSNDMLDQLRSDAGLMRLVLRRSPDQARFVAERGRAMARTLLRLRFGGAPLRTVRIVKRELKPVLSPRDFLSRGLILLASIGGK